VGSLEVLTYPWTLPQSLCEQTGRYQELFKAAEAAEHAKGGKKH
jgi:hypothetical protein